jgi:hypothetical protein
MAKKSDKTKALKKAVKQYKKAIAALKEVQGGYVNSIEVGGTIDDLEADIHELEMELEESKEEDEEN